MSQQLDAQGEAHQALGTAVASYGPRVLSDPHTLGNLVADLLPDLPRERSLLVTGAEADVAAEMRQHVEDQHIDPDTAVQLVARTLSERRAIDPAAGLWVAAEYAQALGYQVQPRTPAVPSGPPPASPAAPAANAMPPAAQVPAQPSWPQAGQVPAQPSWPPAGQVPAQPSWPPAGQAAQSPQSWPPDGRRPEGVSPAGQMPQRPPGQFWQPSLPQQPWTPPGSAAQSWPPAGAPPQSWPLAGPPPGQSWPPVQSSSGTPKSSWTGRKLGLIAGGTVIALLGGYLIAAVFVHTVPFAKAKARPAAVSSALHSVRPAAKPTQPATPAPTGPVAAAGVAPLMQLLPGDIDDPATQCQNDPPPYDWDMTGRVAAMICSDPGLPKGTEVHAYQLDSQAHFEATWQSFNKVIGFNSADAGGDCPPAKGGEGTAPMHSKWFPPRAGQVFECLTVQDTNGKPQPLITWTFPTEDTYIVVVGPDSSSFAPLLAWFTSASMPLASPSPAAS